MYFIMKPLRIITKNGFTLIEMLVSVALFMVVMTVGLSVILSIVDGNKKTQAIGSVVNNLNASIDSMVRDLKTGYKYDCTGSLTPVYSTGCSPSSTAKSQISFISTLSGGARAVEYEYIAGSVNQPGYIQKIVCPGGICSAAVRVTSPEINVTDFRMYVSTPPATQGQPGIFIVIGGTAKVNATTISDFHLQTFVTQRILNI